MTSNLRIKFVTDSTCDIPPELVEHWNITVVPCYVNHAGKSYADDGVELVREDFYDRLPTLDPSPTTAAPPPAMTESLIKAAFQDADHLIIICVPAKLSAVYNSMRLGMADLPPDRVTLIDSGQTSMGLGWQVLAGVEVAAQTGDVAQVVEAINRVRAHQRVYAAIATMEFLRRSGRVSALVASLGTLLQIKPIISVEEGDILAPARVRTFKAATEKLVELIRAQTPLDRLAILHTNNLEGAEEVRKALGDAAPPDSLIVRVNPTVGVHIGPGCVGAATLNTNWKG